MKLYERFPLYIANSLSGKKELFEPLSSGRVGMYVCGPTVYSNVHLGNVRTFIAFDVMARYLRRLGYQLRYVRNVTDVGHLESDHDDGEDKILKKARLEQIEPMEVAQRYTHGLHMTLQRFNVEPPSIEPRATGHIIEQIELVERLLRKGLAYEVNGSVYFDVKKFNQSHRYGALSGRVLEELIDGHRQLSNQDEKRDRLDFALWKKASPRHIMHWPSPWGEGFPGWHIECTAMSTKYLGKTFDIHGGGMDLKFPHHDCEIAQSVGALGCSPARYWIHANMLTVNGQKMSKSLGNSLLPEELIAGSHPLMGRAFDAMTLRFFMLQSHYSSTLDFSKEALLAAEKGYKKLTEAQVALEQALAAARQRGDDSPNEALEQEVDRLTDEAYRSLSDDFNTAKALAILFEMATLINRLRDGLDASASPTTLMRFAAIYRAILCDVLGLSTGAPEGRVLLDGVVGVLVDLRKKAREDRNFALSDQIRDQLLDLGIQLKDGKNGSTEYVLTA